MTSRHWSILYGLVGTNVPDAVNYLVSFVTDVGGDDERHRLHEWNY